MRNFLVTLSSIIDASEKTNSANIFLEAFAIPQRNAVGIIAFTLPERQFYFLFRSMHSVFSEYSSTTKKILFSLAQRRPVKKWDFLLCTPLMRNKNLLKRTYP
jgi:hypothetical protein